MAVHAFTIEAGKMLKSIGRLILGNGAKKFGLAVKRAFSFYLPQQ
jgi:hypothetical protein